MRNGLDFTLYVDFCRNLGIERAECWVVGEGDFVEVQNIQIYLKPAEQRKVGRLCLSRAQLSIVVELVRSTLMRTHVKDVFRTLKGLVFFFLIK